MKNVIFFNTFNSFFKSIFRVLFPTLIVLGFLILGLYAQDTDTPTTSSSETSDRDSAYSNSYEELLESDAAENIIRYEIFSPKFPELEETLRDADQRYFDQILKVLDQVKTELNSTYIALNDKKTRLDRLGTLQGREFYRADILLATNYYKTTLPATRNQYYLIKSVNFLNQIEEILNRRLASIEAIVDESMLLKVTYELKTLLGVTHTLRGGTNNLYIAASQFEYILGDNKENIEFVQSEAELRSTYYYLAGIYNELYQKVNYTDEIQGRILIRKKLFYLWKLVELNTPDNQALKDVKLQDLAERYVTIIDFESVNYKNLYAPYVNKIVERFKEVEELVEESPVNPLSGATSPPPPAEEEEDTPPQ